MNSIKKIVKYAKEKNFSSSSRILNLSHSDLDGVVAVINLKSFVEETENFFYVLKSYNNINTFFTETYFKNNCTFKKPDFIIVSDLSIDEEIVEAFENRPETLLVLDHHETAYHLNKYENCFVDDSNTKSGAEVTLNFIKELGFKETYLDKLNKIATEFDLFLFKTDEHRKFMICGEKRSLAEMMNTLFFKTRDNDDFIKRWMYGWGKGFNKEEIRIIKTEYSGAQKHIQDIEGGKLKVQLDEDKVLIFSSNFLVSVCDYYLDKKDNNLVLSYNIKRSKVSGRVNDNSPINIGKIFKLLYEKCDFVTAGGGHDKAGGCNLKNNECLDEFVEKVVKLCAYYEK